MPDAGCRRTEVCRTARSRRRGALTWSLAMQRIDPAGLALAPWRKSHDSAILYEGSEPMRHPAGAYGLGMIRLCRWRALSCV
jgi:hypothetical protein